MMRELHDIETSLLENDGSCRDLNFEAPTWKGVGSLLASIGAAFHKVTATDQDGKELVHPLGENAIAEAQKGGSVHISLNGGEGPIKNLLIFICSDGNGAPFVELTFFPDDVEKTSSLRGDFIAWAQHKRSLLEARRYYARYENASWNFGDIGTQSGVFLVSDDVSTNP